MVKLPNSTEKMLKVAGRGDIAYRQQADLLVTAWKPEATTPQNWTLLTGFDGETFLQKLTLCPCCQNSL